MARHRSTDPVVGLSRDSLETLLDLVEIRLSSVEIVDREDAREMKQLQRTRDQLTAALGLDPTKAVSAGPEALEPARQRRGPTRSTH